MTRIVRFDVRSDERKKWWKIAFSSQQFQVKCEKVLDSQLFAIFTIVITLVAQFLAVIALWSFPKTLDIGVAVISALIIVLFLVETIVSCIVNIRYMGRLYFWLDIISIGSLIPDVYLFSSDAWHGIPIGIIQMLKVASANKLARTSLHKHLGNQLMKLKTLFVICLKKLTILESDRYRRESEKAEDKNKQVIGRLLLEATTRKVIVGVLLVLVVVPMLYDTIGLQTTDVADTFLLTQLNLVNTFNSSIFKSIESSIKKENAELLRLTWHRKVIVPFNESKQSPLRDWEIIWLHAFAKDGISKTETGVGSYPYIIDSGVVAWISQRNTVALRCQMDFYTMLFVIVMLVFGAFLFSRDMECLVIQPINRIQSAIRRLQGDIETVTQREKDQSNELESTLDKVGALMQVMTKVSQVFDEKEQAEAALDEVLSALNGSRAYIFWIFPKAREVSVLCCRNNSNMTDFQTDNVPSYVTEVVQFVERHMKPILVNCARDLSLAEEKASLSPSPKPSPQNCTEGKMKMNSGNQAIGDFAASSLAVISLSSFTKIGTRKNKKPKLMLSESVRQKLHKYSILCCPMKVFSRFVGVMYVEKERVFRKDVKDIFGTELSTEEIQRVTKHKRRSSGPDSVQKQKIIGKALLQKSTSEEKRSLQRKGSVLRQLKRKGSVLTKSLVRRADSFVRRTSIDQPEQKKVRAKDEKNYAVSDLDLIQALANQAGSVLNLTQTIRTEVEQRMEKSRQNIDIVRKTRTSMIEVENPITLDNNELYEQAGIPMRRLQIVQEKTQASQVENVRHRSKSYPDREVLFNHNNTM